MTIKHSILLFFSLILIFISGCCNPCEEVECLNNGVCQDGTCDCPEPFYGEECEIDLSQIKLKSITRRFSWTLEFTYNENDLISTETKTNANGTLNYNISYDFTNDTLIRNIVTGSGVNELRQKNKIYRSGINEITRELYIHDDINDIEYYDGKIVFILNDDCGASEEQYFDFTNNKTQTTFWYYLEGTCNWTTETLSTTGILISKNQAKTDEVLFPKPNPLDYFRILRKGFVNELISYDTSVDSTGNTVNNLFSYKSNIQYRDNNLPEIESRLYNAGQDATFIYEYY